MENKKNKGDKMTALAIKTENDIKQMAAVLAAFPEPGKWTKEQKAQAVNFAALLETAQKMIAIKSLAGINYNSEKQTFLKNAGKTASRHTRAAYAAGIERLETWTAAQGINILELTPAQADDFIYSLRGNRASASVRLDAAAASSFFTFLHRRHNAIENVFRGTRARPQKKAVKKIEVPQDAEIKIIIKELSPELAAAAAVMAYRGLRAGALPTLSITGGKFTGYSKGKAIQGKLPAAALDTIKAASLPLRSPFSGIKENTLIQQIKRAITRLYKAGKVKAAYSAHDLRHYYAVTSYKTSNHDIHYVSKMLGHASIQITETYLRGLGELDI
jgi:site-specific recombinase XerD